MLTVHGYGKLIQQSLILTSKAGEYPRGEHVKGLRLGMSVLHSQILDKAAETNQLPIQ